MRQTSERHRIPEIQGTLPPPTTDLRQQSADRTELSAPTSTRAETIRADFSHFLRDIALERNADKCRNMLSTLNTAELSHAQGDRAFKNRLSDWAKTIVLREKEKVDPTTLINVARKLSVVYHAGINFENHREQPFTTQTLLFALQVKAPREAVKFAAAALDCGAAIAPTMTLVTLRKAIESAHSLEDLKASGKLAISALRTKAILEHQDTTGTYNVITAKFCQHDLDIGRISSVYKENDVVDIAHRMVVGAQILRAAVDKGVPFNTEDSEGRVNVSVRAFAAVAAALHLEGIKDELLEQISVEHRPADIVTALKDELEVDLDWRSADLNKHKRTNYDALSITLLESAIDLVDQSLVWKGHSKPVERYKIEGSTINSLFYALAQAEFPMAIERCRQLSSILEKAVHTKEINIKLYSKAITALLKEVAFAEGLPEKEQTSLLVHIATEAPFVKISKPLLRHILQKYEAAHFDSNEKPYPPPEDVAALRRAYNAVGSEMHKRGHKSDSAGSEGVNDTIYSTSEHSADGWFSSLLSVTTPGLAILRNHANESTFS